MNNPLQSGPLLRYFVPQECRDEHLDELFRTCERVGIAEVSLFSSDYICGAIFEPLPKFKQRIEHLAFCADRIRKVGLIFSLNVMHMLGHLFVPQHEVDHHGFQRQLDAEGKPALNPGMLEPTCPRVRAYLLEAYRLYSQLHPRLLFLDDDYKVPLGQCFAPGRVARFAQQAECAPNAQAVNALLHSPDSAVRWQARERMMELVTEDMVSLSTGLREAAHGIDPNIRLGLMHAGHIELDVEKVARALAGNHRPYVRPQIAVYREELPIPDYLSRFWSLDQWKAWLPKDFEFYPECENYPYDPSLKSPEAAYAHYAYCLAAGEPRVALSLNSFATAVPACESRALVDLFSEKSRQIKAITEIVADGGDLLGPAVWEDALARTFHMAESPDLRFLQCKGVPLRIARSPEEAILHWGNSLERLTDAQILTALSHGGIFDARSVQILKSRGLLEQTGLELVRRCTKEEVLHSRFTRRDGSIELCPFFYFISRTPGTDHLPFIVRADNSTTHCNFQDEHGQMTAPLVVTWTSPSGARFGLLNVPVGRVGNSLINPWITDAIVQSIEWIQGRPLPARIDNPWNMSIKVLRLSKPSRLLLTLCNLSTGHSNGATVRIAPEFTTWRWSRIEADGRFQGIEVQSTNRGPILELTNPLACLGCEFLLAESQEAR